MNTLYKRATQWVAIITTGMLFSIISVSADTIVYEGFDIPPGEIDNTSGETSWGWKTENDEQVTWWAWDEEGDNTGGLDLYHGISDEGLSYEGLSTVGNAFEFHLENEQARGIVHRELPQFYQYYSSGHLWISALFNPKIDGDPDGGGWFQLVLEDTRREHQSRNQLYLGISNSGDYNQTVWSAGGERLYVEGQDGVKWAVSEEPVIDGETAFLVLHLNFEEKTAEFFANPAVDVEDPGEPVAKYDILSDLFVNSVVMMVFNYGPSYEDDEGNPGEGADYIGSRIDEVRLGDTYASVAGGADEEDPGGGDEDTTPPEITGPSGEPGDDTSEASIDENTVKVTDMEADEAVTWEIIGGDDGDMFTIGSGTGGLSFETEPDFEDPQDADGDNVYVVEIQATDTADNSSTQTVSVTVLDVVLEPWAFWTPDEDDWISSDADESKFMGWINIRSAPWIYVLSLGKYVYLPEDNVNDTGAWSYAQLSVPSSPGDYWGYWNNDGGGWISTNADDSNFLDWLNVLKAPWIYSQSLEKYIYLPESNVTQSGSWLYARVTPPAEEEEEEDSN